jgi:hypothetical protein
MKRTPRMARHTVSREHVQPTTNNLTTAAKKGGSSVPYIEDADLLRRARRTVQRNAKNKREAHDLMQMLGIDPPAQKAAAERHAQTGLSRPSGAPGQPWR